MTDALLFVIIVQLLDLRLRVVDWRDACIRVNRRWRRVRRRVRR